jgi:error-prone DNA polymerase
MPSYLELAAVSNFSFLEGASHPHELVRRAAELGHAGIAIADRNTLAGVVRAHVAAKELREETGRGFHLVVGARLIPENGPETLAFPTDRAAYGRLARLLTLGKRRAPKGECRFAWDELLAHGEGQIFVVLPPTADDPQAADWPDSEFRERLTDLARRCPGAVHLAGVCRYDGADAARLDRCAALADRVGTPLIAVNDVHYHAPVRRPLQDVLTCIRLGTTVAAAGYRLAANAERHLKSADEMARLFHGRAEAVERGLAVAERCRFSLDELRYEYPEEMTREGRTPDQELEVLTFEGARSRYPEGISAAVERGLRHELDLIRQLNYAPFFLTVYDIVRFARSKGILCQGRGSAANSSVCYCLGITAVDPSRVELLFERFVSAARNEPPDIDVDFEHERREEVIQYVYGKYTRERAGLAATVIGYRARSATREVGKAMGLSGDAVDKLSRTVWGWSDEAIDDERVREAGLDPTDRTLRLVLDLARDLIGFPRHLSQHVGGFVITRGPLSEVAPIANAAMDDRTTIEWDKDDLDALGILKVDVLGLGMLTCIRKGFDLLRRHRGLDIDLATVPAEDSAVYDMLCRADSIGVFQVESRAQMSMLPRLKPRAFYDLVVEVAIVRPGPIQGDMVHPYLRRRNGEEKVTYPSDDLRRVLEKTLGVPLFQEQAMRIAIVAAGFTPTEADRLRRAMATFRRNGEIHLFRDKLIEGMAARGYERDFAERCYRQIEGFGTYGFPESHAASFALLVYVSAWLKCRHPAAFACALLNAQPMGFYAPAQIVRDAAEHGVEIRPVDVNHSDWDCTLEARSDGELALRLGFRQVKGAREADVERLLAARGGEATGGIHPSFADLVRRTRLPPSALETFADADAFRSLGLSRRQALWEVRRLDRGERSLPLFEAAPNGEAHRPEPRVTLPAMSLGEEVTGDYVSVGLSLKCHPAKLLRSSLDRDGLMPTARLQGMGNGHRARVAGLVLVRQRPGSAKGIIFVTLEDETGIANLVIHPPVFERYRKEILGARLLAAYGRIDREGSVIHVVARRLVDLSDRLAWLAQGRIDDRTVSETAARADEAKRPGHDRPEIRPASRDFH